MLDRCRWPARVACPRASVSPGMAREGDPAAPPLRRPGPRGLAAISMAAPWPPVDCVVGESLEDALCAWFNGPCGKRHWQVLIWLCQKHLPVAMSMLIQMRLNGRECG